ncbi:MAG TPA: serpin family protein [Polyangiales bacterium]|nr:serpin family protein [Polyangiales bacterium]
MTQHGYSVASLAWLTVAVAVVGCSGESSVASVERHVDASSQAIRAAVHSNAAVASKLAGALKDQPGNLFYSPLSIEAASGILLAGAGGDTAAQLATLLDAQADHEALHDGLGALLRDLRREHPQYTLSVANKLWAVPGLESSQRFTDTTRDDYDAPTALVDFTNEPEAARGKINQWVSDQTARKIPELLKPGQITEDTVMAVVNAMYFKADWAKAFDSARTRRQTFHRAGATDVTVDMMSSDKIPVRTLSTDGARWIELPYRTGDVSFLAYTTEAPFGAAPGPVTSVQQLQEDLEGVDIDEVVASLSDVEIEVQMPRFSLRSRIDLVPLFRQLGVTDLFDERRADLTNISADGGLYVNPFVHEAAVWVDEQGTVAVAATAGGVVATSAVIPLLIDHPFLFFIRDNLTGAILFSGRVADPTESADD